MKSISPKDAAEYRGKIDRVVREARELRSRGENVVADFEGTDEELFLEIRRRLEAELLPLEGVVRGLIESAGFEISPDGTFAATRDRTTFGGTLIEATRWAKRNGLESLGRKLGVESANLVVSSERNRFLERRAGNVFGEEMSSRAERLGIGKPVEVEEEDE